MTYLAPGVYIEEVPSGPQPIAAAPTSVVAIVGTTERGPYLDPTRITGWGQFLEVFGGTTDRGFTAESVFGFFENGGPAAYVVRVDPSVDAEWTVDDAAGNEQFRVTASSPGAWANDLEIGVTPDTSGGNGQFYVGRVTVATPVPGTGTTEISVASTTGISIGDAVVLVAAEGPTRNATVTAVSPTSVTVSPSGAANPLAVGDVVAGAAANGATSVRLPAANGIRNGDVVVAELPDRTRISARATTAINDGASMTLTLASALGTQIPGAQFAVRTDRFGGTLAVGKQNVALGDITWDDETSVRPQAVDIASGNHRAFAANGLQASWVSGNSRFEFPVAAPAGRIEVEAVVAVHRFTETVELVNPTAQDLTTRYGFVPTGGVLRLTHAGGTSEVTRTPASFNQTSGDPITATTFTAVEYRLPADARTGVVVRCARPVAVGDIVDFGGANQLPVTDVTAPGGTIQVLDFGTNTNLSAVAGSRFVVRNIGTTKVAPLRFALTVSRDGVPVETFGSLGLDSSHPFFYYKDDQINGRSANIRVSERDTANPVDAADLPVVATASRAGSDGVAESSNFRAGFTALESEPEPAMVICPETTKLDDPLIAADVVGAMVVHCQTFRRLAVVDAPRIDNDQDLVDWRNQTVASTYASVYAPHVKIVNLDPDAVERFSIVPPSGFVTGVMARVDRVPPGVAKAPANEQVFGIVGVDQTYTQRRQDLLNPNAVNILRAFPGRGIRVWGARNATDDTTWRYTNVRRLFNAIETSIERGTQWVVFEPNTASTWLRVKVSVEGFLEQRWRAGELAGSTPAEAFRVAVGLGETMTEDQIDLGLVIVEVKIAPAKPAEFVVFRFSHKRLSE